MRVTRLPSLFSSFVERHVTTVVTEVELDILGDETDEMLKRFVDEPRSESEMTDETQRSQKSRDAPMIEYFSSLPMIDVQREQTKHSG